MPLVRKPYRQPSRGYATGPGYGYSIPPQGDVEALIDPSKKTLKGKGEFSDPQWLGKPQPQSMKRGGKVKKTGTYKLHKGEQVLTAKQARGAKKPNSKAIPAVKAIKAKRADRARSVGAKRKR